MRAVLSIGSLLIVLLIVSVLAKQNLTGMQVPAAAPGASAASGAAVSPQGPKAVQQHVKSEVEKALEQGAAQREQALESIK
jgi:hypothetical protein